MNESQIVGIILIILGGFQAVRADLFIKFQIWTQKVIMGATYIPTQRTYTIVRTLGSLVMILGLLTMTKIIE